MESNPIFLEFEKMSTLWNDPAANYRAFLASSGRFAASLALANDASNQREHRRSYRWRFSAPSNNGHGVLNTPKTCASLPSHFLAVFGFCVFRFYPIRLSATCFIREVLRLSAIWKILVDLGNKGILIIANFVLEEKPDGWLLNFKDDSWRSAFY